MSVYVLANIIDMLASLLSIVVLLSIVLSWFLPPFNPFREALDRLVDPLLAPIRRVVPAVGMFDFSPLILMILIQLIAQILKGFILSL